MPIIWLQWPLKVKNEYYYISLQKVRKVYTTSTRSTIYGMYITKFLWFLHFFFANISVWWKHNYFLSIQLFFVSRWMAKYYELSCFSVYWVFTTWKKNMNCVVHRISRTEMEFTAAIGGHNPSMTSDFHITS